MIHLPLDRLVEDFQRQILYILMREKNTLGIHRTVKFKKELKKEWYKNSPKTFSDPRIPPLTWWGFIISDVWFLWCVGFALHVVHQNRKTERERKRGGRGEGKDRGREEKKCIDNETRMFQIHACVFHTAHRFLSDCETQSKIFAPRYDHTSD